ncbi:MAG: A/G-specific adenine glycosylase [Holophagaceae bacterium]|nr:A/G-specific adenine glycosylase [Holophagaceae bacterium]
MHWPDSPALLAPLGPWFETERRDLPWRDGDLDRPHPDPYAVLVSELMLQQTQVATVIPYFKRWMANFPDAKALSEAREDDIHKLWEGLGYYRRARHLQASAKLIEAGGWPSDFQGLMELPGLGPYTAAAVASIAFGWPEPALDGNAFRVAARILGLEGDPKPHAKDLRSWLRPALEKHGASRITQSLMELGATICAPVPKCGKCPMAARCRAHQADATDRIPPVVQRLKPKESEIWLVAVEAEGRWLLRQPSHQGMLAGLWKWPTVEAAGMTESGLAADPLLAYASTEMQVWPGWTQVYTHRREMVNPVHLRLAHAFEGPDDCRWLTGNELDQIALGKRDQRLRSLIKGTGTTPVQGPAAASLLARIKGDATRAG